MAPEIDTKHNAAERVLYDARVSPHRSLTRAQTKILLGLFGLFCFATSIPFLILGAWPVAGFLGLDVIAVCFAFAWSFRDARAHETFRVTPLELHFAKVSPRGRRREWRFNPGWVRIERSEHEEFGLERVAFVSRGRAIEFAGFLGPEQKAQVARDVGAALHAARRGPDFSS